MSKIPKSRRCVLPRCQAREGICLFAFPKNEEKRERWIEFVKQHAAGSLLYFRITNAYLCSQHFTTDSFSNWHRRQLGFTDKPLMLVTGAEPTIYIAGGLSDKDVASHDSSSQQDSQNRTPPILSVEDRDKAVATVDPHSCTSDPESSVAAITEIIGFSDENDSSGEGSSEVDEGEQNSDRDWDPLEHNIDGQLLDSELDEDEKREEDRFKLCPECGAFFYNEKTHMCENKKPYSCNFCGMRYLSAANLKAHSRVHQDGYKHVCKYCSSIFKTRTDKLVHEQSHLPAEKPYQCPDCPEVFSKMQERNGHLVSHRGPRNVCHICNMNFRSNFQLERHLAVHTKEKRFVCDVCQRSFTQRSHLKSHMRVHTGEKPYECQHCNKSFNHNVSLKTHIQRYHGQVPDPGEKVQMEQTNRNVSEVEKDETNDMEISDVDAEEAKTDETGSSGVDTDAAKSSNTWVTKKKRYKCKSTGRPRGRPKKNEHGCDEEKKERVGKRKRCTGRPIGRPKKNAVIISDDANQLNKL